MIDLQKELAETYQVRTRSQQKLEVELQPAKTWPYFVGHFPQMPVLPAVAIVDISQYFVENLLGTSVSLVRLMNFRIKNPVQPGDKVLVEVQKESEGVFNILWTKPGENKTLADLNLQVAEG